MFIGSTASMHISVTSINLVVAYYLCGVLIGCVASGIFVIDHPANTRRRFDIEFTLIFGRDVDRLYIDVQSTSLT